MGLAEMNSNVIVAGARTPIGRLLGALSDYSAVELGATAIRAALARANLDAKEVDYVVMGQVLQAGCGQNPARQAAHAAGIPMRVPSLTINKVCLSGLNAIALADQMISSGVANVVVAGGMESMSNAPHYVAEFRKHKQLIAEKLIDPIFDEGLFCAFDHSSMGVATERYNSRYGISRADQDEVALASHLRASAARDILLDEIAAIDSLGSDEGVRADVSIEALSKLKPVFDIDGTITAGNASQISDGAAAMVVMSKSHAQKLGLNWLAEIVSTASVAGPDASLHEQPANAIMAALDSAQLTVQDVDLFEINEAFAAVAVVSSAKLGLPAERVNVNGGAIALGHPLGMSGTRLPLTLAYELHRRGGGVGAAALCGGGGQGEAIVLRVSN